MKSDPLGLLRSFKNQKDLEIMGLFLATIAWGNRKSIIQSGKKLIDIFENEPYYFVKSYDSSLTNKLTDFKHRTFNGFDLHFFIERLRDIYKEIYSGGSAAIARHLSTFSKKISLLSLEFF